VSIDTHVLAMVLRAATGKRLAEYLGEKIIAPIGFRKAPYYVTDNNGNAFALGGLNITTRDYARFGQMILNDGKWKGVPVVPASWVVESTAPNAPKPADPTGEFGYGYQWWVPPTDDGEPSKTEVLARGIYGQYIYINRATRTVIVKTSAHRGFRKVQPDGTSVHANSVGMFRAIADAQ
jgi:CubicO group peptidase (beta-lactamase class C family)